MADTWPTTLPGCFLGGTYQESEALNNMLETPEVAVPKSRPLSTASVRELSGQLKMSLEQVQILRTFGRTTLVQWVLPFWFPAQSGEEDPDMAGKLLVRFSKDGLPQYSKVTSNQYIVGVKFYVLP